ncbi:MAG: isoprenylcysteine carboxylmethyltransferase family protein [Sphingomicrobium sp.]
MAIAILTVVTAQRLSELWLSNRNTRHLLDQGAVEVGRSHYLLLVSVHVAWLAALWWWAPGQPINWTLVALFVLLQFARVWVIATLGPRWTTRIIVLPGAPLVRAGPYRFVDHPNYLIVALEIAILPLAFDLAGVALIFSILNAAILTVRIRAENQALVQ